MQLIRSHSHLTGFNLAAEEYLFSQRTDEILFLYVNEPSVVIGCNQAILSEVDIDFCSANSIPLFRRMSGGGAVYHDKGNLNYCFINNKTPGVFPLEQDFLQPIVQILNDFNINASIGKRKDLWLPGGNKISGTASHVSKIREIHHGTLLYDADLEKLQSALSLSVVAPISNVKAIASVPSPVKNIRSYLTEQKLSAPVAPDFFQLFTQKLLDFYRLDTVSQLSNEETEHIQQLLDSKYESKAWNYKK